MQLRPKEPLPTPQNQALLMIWAGGQRLVISQFLHWAQQLGRVWINYLTVPVGIGAGQPSFEKIHMAYEVSSR